MGEIWPASAPVSLLVVEDDPEVSGVVGDLLTEEGFEVHVARAAHEALTWLESHVPSLILLDLLIPDMPGWEFDRLRRADPRLAAIPLAVTSGLPAAEIAARGIEAVARLPKPYRAEDLLSLIRQHARPGPLYDPTADTADVDPTR